MSRLGHSRSVNERVLKWRGKGPSVSAVLDKHWGEEGCVTKKKIEEANSHIWRHHGGSLQNQLSGKYN